MSDDRKEDYNDIESLLSEEEDNDFISSDETTDDASDHEQGVSEEEAEETEEFEEFEEAEEAHSEFGEDPDERHESDEFQDDYADEPSDEDDRTRKIQSYAALGGVGVILLGGVGFVASQFVGNSAPDPVQPTFSAGSDVPNTEEVPQEQGFGELIGPEANGDQGDNAPEASQDPVPAASKSESQPEIDFDFGDDGGAEDSNSISNSEQPDISGESSDPRSDLDVDPYDERMSRAMDELSKEADLVGQSALEAAITDVRSYVDGRFESALKEREEIREQIREAQAENERQNAQMAEIERGIEAFKAEVAEAMAVAEKRMAKLEERDPVATNIDPVDLDSIKDLDDRERLAGFKILSTSDNGKLAITKTPTGKVQVFFTGETLVIRGKGAMKVTGVHAEGRVVLVGDKYFFDEVYEKPKYTPVKRKQPERKEQSSASTKEKHAGMVSSRDKREKPSEDTGKGADFVIAEHAPSEEKTSGSESTSTISTEAPSGVSNAGRKLAEGWKVVGNDVNQDRFLVKSPAGRWHPVKVGQMIPELGEVFGMDENRNLLVGEHIIVNK